ncbi:hypothetical protein [Bacillus gobiensis]|uniref:hypothetical protein n=1 Tax=Bacillus gobiensis TaxID=1441095 RepID=UPI003D19784F
MNQEAIIRILQELSYFSNPLMEANIKRKILLHYKEKRKGLTKEEIIEKGLDIYEKKGTTFDSLLSGLIQQEYVNIESVSKKQERKVCLTAKGLEYLISLYTNNHCGEFLSYEQSVNDLTENRNETNFNPLHIAGMYYSKRSLTEIEKLYFTEKSLQDEVQDYHEYLLSLHGLNPDKDDFLFHALPKLFLPQEDMLEDVEFSAEGIEFPNPIILDRPYPNKRYVVAGIIKGREKVTTGFYLNLGNKEGFPKEKEIRYHWKLGNGKEIIHDIHIAFQIDRGSLFSTEQSLNRSNDIPCIRLATFVEDAPIIWENRTIEYINKERKFLYMREKVTLTSFPARLHSCFGADASYDKWREKKRKSKI